MQKKNNWLKFKTDFFASLEMKKIRKIAGGDSYIIIYQKLMLLTVNTEGHYHLSGIEPTIEEELALIIDEDVDNVRIAINILKSLNLINHDSNVIFLNKVPDLIGKNDDSSLRVAAYRERKKLECNALQSLQVTESNDPREREREREDIEKDKNKQKNASTDALLCVDYFNKVNGTKNTVDKTIINTVDKHKPEKSEIFDITKEQKPRLMNDRTWELFKEWWILSRKQHKLANTKRAFDVQIKKMHLNIDICNNNQYEIVEFSMNYNKDKTFQNICLPDKCKERVEHVNALIDSMSEWMPKL